MSPNISSGDGDGGAIPDKQTLAARDTDTSKLDVNEVRSEVASARIGGLVVVVIIVWWLFAKFG